MCDNTSELTPAQLAACIDHTLLRPGATAREVSQLCDEALEYGFASVCVSPARLDLAVSLTQGTAVCPITVVGFPSGATTTACKVLETHEAVSTGATEIDMVAAHGLLFDGNHDAYQADIAAVVAAAGSLPVKVIVETCLLDEPQIVRACQLAEAAGARWVKTSTGFSTAGATVEVVQLMRGTVTSAVGVKASGGIRTTADALAMLRAGADRLGASASIAIVRGFSDSGASAQHPNHY